MLNGTVGAVDEVLGGEIGDNRDGDYKEESRRRFRVRILEEEPFVLVSMEEICCTSCVVMGRTFSGAR